MCRLFAVLASKPVKVNAAFRALAAQSKEHKDGWGVVHFDDAAPQVERGLEPAGLSPRFEALGASLESRALLAHIRLASVGPVTLQNNHPFISQGWAFMHNGTVKNWAPHREEVEALLPPPLRSELKGETESERCFALFLSLLPQSPLPPASCPLPHAARALAQAVRTVIARCDRDAEIKAALNFLACDGKRLVATRHGRTLWLYQGEGVRVVASEKLWPEGNWEELKDGDLIAIDGDLGVRRWRIQDME
jgi:predicted glutamine amidotransferase